MTGTTGNLFQFLPRSAGEPIPLNRIRQIGFEGQPRPPAGPGLSGRLLLQGDEFISGEAISADRELVTISLPAGMPITIPRSAARGIFQPPGEQLRLRDDFDGDKSLFEGGRLIREPSGDRQGVLEISSAFPKAFCHMREPFVAGRLDFAFQDNGKDGPAEAWSIDVEFGDANRPVAWQFFPGGAGSAYRCELSDGTPLTRQEMERTPGWHRFTLLIGPERNFAFVDGRLIATCRGWNRPLTLVRLELKDEEARDAGVDSEKAANRRRGAIDDFLLMERVEEVTAPAFDQRQDQFWLATGDELFGDFESLDRTFLKFGGHFGHRKIEWSACRGITFRQGHVAPSATVRGLIATIDLGPLLGASEERSGRLYGAIESVDETMLRVRHPVLGLLSIPIASTARIEPVFTGTLQIIDPASHHFGDEIREDFRMKLAEGPQREWKFEVESVPKGTTSFLTLLAADVEPGAPDAPRNGRYREELEKGGLRTELLLNGRPLGALNRHVRLKSLPDNPERLRIPIPTGTLRAGENVLKLRQYPLRDEPGQFDDCEISRVAIEGE